MKAAVDLLETIAAGDVVGTATKTRKEVAEEVIMEWQRMGEVLDEPKEADEIEFFAQHYGLLTWQQAYKDAKSALKLFGLRSNEYRIAKRVLDTARDGIVRPYDERLEWNAGSLQKIIDHWEKFERLLAKKHYERTFCEEVFLRGFFTDEEQKFLAKHGREGMCNEEFGQASEA